MKKPIDAEEFLVSRAEEDSDFRERLLTTPKATIEGEFGVALPEGHEIHVYEETATVTHLVLPPRDSRSEAERQAAKTGAASLEFLRKTLHDPAPPVRSPARKTPSVRKSTVDTAVLARAGRDCIRRGLEFLESAIDENGAWHCIRFNIADPDIPRHFERPPFVSALCILALENCDEPRAKAICTATRAYIANTIEYPGLWRYYRHLPQDLDSTALCSLVLGTHPWILLGRNVPPVLANRDEEGRFMTWVLAEDEPNVVSTFRIEADPVVNANVIAYLGDHPETEGAQRWLEALITEDNLEGSSKWYPDTVAIYYATARAMIRARPSLDRLSPILVGRILSLRDEQGQFGNILQTAQAISALYNVGGLERMDATRQVERLIGAQHEDGSWPELLAFGDQSLKWGVFGQIGHGSEAVTTAFCIEALERLVDFLRT
ncbi:MAG: NHLP leader peptide family RiPP precursor [Chloroflexi bacterium]|nr:NHLP leader peptide family RiPP precursor [Chloroflexota bacterium]